MLLKIAIKRLFKNLTLGGINKKTESKLFSCYHKNLALYWC